MQFRYDTNGQWFKGNTHIHSTASDGGKSFTEIAELYAGAGYDFLFRTDHWVASDVSQDTDTYPLLWLDGIELHGEDQTGARYHVVCLGTVADIRMQDGLVAAIEVARSQGAFIILAHPHWMGNTLEDALRWGFGGVEIYNHVCRWLNGKGDGSVYWDAMLRHNGDTVGLAVDDAHLRPEHPGWNGGWIMVNAHACTAESILSAIREGHFYSSCGPQIHSLHYDGDQLEIATSPVQFIRVAGPGSLGQRIGSFDDQRLTSASLQLPQDWDYVYLEIEDEYGRRAWTNTLFRRALAAE